MRYRVLFALAVPLFIFSNSAFADPPAGGSGGVFCPQLSRYLVRGASAEEVKELQKFLSYQTLEVYPEKLITGYFGILTENAVKRWQAKNGIVSSGSSHTTGYGAVGSKTRSKIKEICTAASQAIVPPPSPAPLPTPVQTPPPAVITPPAPSLDLKVNGIDGPINLVKNSSVIISWNLSNHPWSYCTKLDSWQTEGSVKSVSGSQSTDNLSYSQKYTLVCYLDSASFRDSVTVNIFPATTTPTSPPPTATSTQAVIPSPKSSGDMTCSLDVSPSKVVIGKDAVEGKWILNSAPVGWPFYWHYIDNGVETGQIYGGKTSYPYYADTVSYPLVPGKYRRYVEIVKDPLWITPADINHPTATCITAAPTFEVSN